MPKTHIAYGGNYRACPCAQIIEKEYSSGSTLYFCKCCSPKRELIKPLLKEGDQVRICMGGSTGGKRYSSCPYYVRGKEIKGAGHKKRYGLGLLIIYTGFVLLLASVAWCCWTTEGPYSKACAIFFGLLAFGCAKGILESKSENVHAGKERK